MQGHPMTSQRSTAKRFEVFPDEMNVMVKFFNLALRTEEINTQLTAEELRDVDSFIDDFKSMSLEWSE